VRALVVDDEPEARELLGLFLQQCGAEVRSCASAAEALAAIADGPPDVLVSDIGLPGVDGYDLMKRVRALGPDRGGAIPAVAVTGHMRREDRLRALAAGFQMHVPKPVNPDELTLVVANLMGRIGVVANA
jgi:CheY-like chemotaxis protein